MFKKNLNSILVLGAISIVGIVVLQLYWLAMTWQIKDNEFHEKVTIALRNVANNMAKKANVDLPKTGLIKQISSNAYLINYNEVIEPDILEDYLIRELDKVEDGIKFEYAVYDCHSNELAYCNYCTVGEKTKEKLIKKIENIEKTTNYFITRFPDKQFFLLHNIKLFILLGLFAIIAVFSYLYAIKSIYRQKKLSELQKDFVDNMTHEFKTPLTSIKLASDVIGKSDEIKSNQRLKKYSSIISQQSEKLTSHIERMLDLIRSDKKFKLKLEQFDLNEFINKLLLGLEDELDYKNLQVTFTKLEKESIINADKYHFNNVVYNIIENALKYNNKDHKKLSVEIRENKHEYLLSFQDNGIGISNDNLTKIFNKFFRVQKGDIHDTKGFGLGLYYVKNIVNLHDWKIEVQSKENEGTAFTIHIKKSE